MKFVVLLAGLMALLSPVVAHADPAPPPFPLDEVIAGERLFVIDAARRLWARQLPLGANSAWRTIRFPGNVGIADPIRCAPDSSGNCAVRYMNGGHGELGLLSQSSDVVVPIGVPAALLVGFIDSTSLYLGRQAGPGRIALFAYNIVNRTLRAAGTVGSEEILETMMLDGRLTLVARRNDGSVRTVDRTPAVVFARTAPPFAVSTPVGMLLAQRWEDVWSAEPRAQNLLLLRYRSGSGGAGARTISSLGTVPITAPLVEYDSLAMDARGDVFGIRTGVGERSIFVLCRGTPVSRSLGFRRFPNSSVCGL